MGRFRSGVRVGEDYARLSGFKQPEVWEARPSASPDSNSTGTWPLRAQRMVEAASLGIPAYWCSGRAGGSPVGRSTHPQMEPWTKILTLFDP